MDALLNAKLGRMLFALPFGLFGLMHFAFASNMTGAVPSFIPGGVIWVYVTGVALVAACVSMMTGKKIRLATALLAVLLLVFVLTVHLPAMMGGDQMAMAGLLKDLSLIGGSLFIGANSTDS